MTDEGRVIYAQCADKTAYFLALCDSDMRHDSTKVANKFVRNLVEAFNDLNRPVDWQSYLKHDLPIVREIPEIVRQAAIERFVDFVATAPLEGIGSDLKTLQRLCHDDPEALDLLNAVTIATPGAPTNNQNASKDKSKDDNVILCSDEAEQGNSRAYALRRLRKERPDLHQRVLAKELSPNAAMIEAGFRKRTLQVYPDDLDVSIS